MNMKPGSYIAFVDHAFLSSGSLPEVARAVRTFLDRDDSKSVAVFDATTSAPIDLDLRGSPSEVGRKAGVLEAELRRTLGHGTGRCRKPGPGRPKLGVVGREVTLLPRHWDWLRAQPGGASVTLRKLVEAARKEGQGAELIRRDQDRTYGFMQALAGDLPGFEEATRALYAWKLDRFKALVEPWPTDLRNHLLTLIRLDSN